jgi:nucleotide-binding universal stress UspA family protein
MSANTLALPLTAADVLSVGATDAPAIAGRQPVLVALKPYDGGDAALDIAYQVARDEARELLAVTVMEASDMAAVSAGVPTLPASYLEEERAAVLDQLELRLARLDAGPRIARRAEVIEGPAARSIVDLARERNACVIVVGTGRHGALGRLVYGERAVQVTRLADRPVLVVPPNTTSRRVAKVVVAVDFSSASHRAARFALDLLADGGELALVHVKSAVKLNEESAGWWEEAYQRRSADLFLRFAASLQVERGITISTHMLNGDVAPTLLAWASELGADLIACGARRHSFLERMLVGSVSEGLMRRAECPVVVVPANRQDGDGSDIEGAAPVGGVVESWDVGAWPGLIDRFRRRNVGRPTQLRLRTASPRGAGSSERGYCLIDVSFDPAAARAEIVLGDPESLDTRLAHRIANVRAVMVCTDAEGHDTALRLDTVSGRCTLTMGEEG